MVTSYYIKAYLELDFGKNKLVELALRNVNVSRDAYHKHILYSYADSNLNKCLVRYGKSIYTFIHFKLNQFLGTYELTQQSII